MYQNLINDQGKELANEVAKSLHKKTGTERRITSEYFPQNAIKTAEAKPQRATIIANTVIQRQLVTLAS